MLCKTLRRGDFCWRETWPLSSSASCLPPNTPQEPFDWSLYQSDQIRNMLTANWILVRFSPPVQQNTGEIQFVRKSSGTRSNARISF